MVLSYQEKRTIKGGVSRKIIAALATLLILNPAILQAALRNPTHPGHRMLAYIPFQNQNMNNHMRQQLQPRHHSGTGKTIVVKQYAGKTVITAYPDMSGIKPTPKQLAQRAAFAKAVAYAQSINNHPAKRAAYATRIGKGRSVYHAALAEYFQKVNNHI